MRRTGRALTSISKPATAAEPPEPRRRSCKPDRRNRAKSTPDSYRASAEAAASKRRRWNPCRAAPPPATPPVVIQIVQPTQPPATGEAPTERRRRDCAGDCTDRSATRAAAPEPVRRQLKACRSAAAERPTNAAPSQHQAKNEAPAKQRRTRRQACTAAKAEAPATKHGVTDAAQIQAQTPVATAARRQQRRHPQVAIAQAASAAPFNVRRQLPDAQRPSSEDAATAPRNGKQLAESGESRRPKRRTQRTDSTQERASNAAGEQVRNLATVSLAIASGSPRTMVPRTAPTHDSTKQRRSSLPQRQAHSRITASSAGRCTTAPRRVGASGSRKSRARSCVASMADNTSLRVYAPRSAGARPR